MYCITLKALVTYFTCLQTKRKRIVTSLEINSLFWKPMLLYGKIFKRMDKKVGICMIYDCVVIGGGPSGLMASVGAAQNKARVLLIDKGDKLGRKLAISGGGRCNVTNRLPVEEIIKHIPGNGRFLYSAFSVFNNEDIISFFENLGIELKEEDHGRMFPVSNKATDVVAVLLQKIRQLGVQIRTNTPVKTIHFNDELHEIVLESGETIQTKSVVIAVGGKSVPHTGSTGDGYAWAKKPATR